MQQPLVDLNMKEDLIGGLYFPFSFEKYGEVESVVLEQDQLEQAILHGGDGNALILKNHRPIGLLS